MAYGRSQLTQFYFTPMIPGTGKVEDDKIEFNAYIMNISYTSSPSWDSVYDMGRADPKIMYKGASRAVQIGFRVVSLNTKDHDDPSVKDSNLNKLQRLGDLTLPIYQANNGYNAPHVLFGIGNLMAGIAYITSFDMDWDNETPWIQEKPVITNVNIGLNVLTTNDGIRPQYNNGKYRFFGK